MVMTMLTGKEVFFAPLKTHNCSPATVQVEERNFEEKITNSAMNFIV